MTALALSQLNITMKIWWPVKPKIPGPLRKVCSSLFKRIQSLERNELCSESLIIFSTQQLAGWMELIKSPLLLQTFQKWTNSQVWSVLGYKLVTIPVPTSLTGTSRHSACQTRYFNTHSPGTALQGKIYLWICRFSPSPECAGSLLSAALRVEGTRPQRMGTMPNLEWLRWI